MKTKGATNFKSIILTPFYILFSNTQRNFLNQFLTDVFLIHSFKKVGPPQKMNTKNK